ncbi:MAG TPA: nucleoside deaminase [Bryobacteraceae bacterium]|jgi:tRNA(Arg) A34 adenosine deaminase TadA
MSDFFMQAAIHLALENVRSGRGGPFGAVVVKDGKILASGANHVTTTNDPTAHAEIVAIRAACAALGTFQLDGCDLYTSCEPCPMCLGAIYWARPRRVFFGARASDAAKAGFDDQFIYDQIATPQVGRSIPFLPLMRDEAMVAFRLWMESPHRVKY